MNYTIKTDSGVHTLQINGNDAMCPFKQDVVVPSQSSLGQMQVQIIRTPCSTLCPFAEVVESTNLNEYIIECHGNHKILELETGRNSHILKSI